MLNSIICLTVRSEDVSEFKILSLSLGVTRADRIRNEYIKVMAQAEWFGNKSMLDKRCQI